MPFLAPISAFIKGLFTVAALKSALVGTIFSIGIGLLFRLPPREEPDVSGAKHTIRGEVVNARWVLGRARVPGVLAYWGSGKEPPHDREARMGLILSEGACEGIDDRMWIDGHAVPLTRSTDADGDLLTPSTTTSKYYGKIEIREYFKADGTQGSHMLQDPLPADTEYQQEDETFGLAPEHATEVMRTQGQTETRPFVNPFPAWTAEHKLNGVSWVYVKLTQPNYGEDLDKRFWNGVPNLEFLVKGIKITWPGQTTPTWTDNAAALRYWWETVRRGRDAGDIHAGDFTSAYNACNQTIDLTGLPNAYAAYRGTPARYTANGVVTAGDDVSRVEDQFDAAWAGEVIEVGGQLRFRPGVDNSVATATITDQDIIEPPVVAPWAPLQDRVNAVDAEIRQSKRHEWTTLGVPRYTDNAARARDGMLRPGSIQLTLVDDPMAAGRLQAILLRRSRESLRLELVVTPGETFERLSLIPTDRVKVTSSEFGLSEARMEVERVSIREDWSVALTLREDLDDTYANTLVLPPLEPRIIRLLDHTTVPAVTNLAADEIAEIAPDGTYSVYLVVTWDTKAGVSTEIRFRRKVTGATWEYGASQGPRWRVSGVVAGNTYEIEARHRNRSDVAGEWASLEHTVGGDLTLPATPAAPILAALPEGFRATWTIPGDEDFSRMLVYVGTADVAADATLTATVDTDYYEARGLTEGQLAYVWIRAQDRSGNLSGYSPSATATPLRTLWDTRSPDAPTVQLTPGGRGELGWAIYVTVELSSDRGEGDISETRIQVSRSTTGFSSATGWPAEDLVVERSGLPGANPTLLWRDYLPAAGSYWVSAQVKNGAAESGSQDSPWSAPIQVTTTEQVEDSDYASFGANDIVLRREGVNVIASVRRPAANVATAWAIEVQCYAGSEFPRRRGYTLGLDPLEVAEVGTGLVVHGGSRLTAIGNPNWGDLIGKLLYVHFGADYETHEVRNPLSGTIVANTGDTADITGGNFRLPPGYGNPPTDAERTVTYVLGGRWLLPGEDLLYWDEEQYLNPVGLPVQETFVLPILAGTLIRFRIKNVWGFGPFSTVLEAPA